MNEFEKMIAAQRREHELRKAQAMVFKVQPKVHAGGPTHNRPLEADASDRDYKALAKWTVVKAQSEFVASVFEKADYFRFNYVPAIIDNVIGFIAQSVLKLVLDSNVHLQGWDDAMENLYDKVRFLYGRYSREGIYFIEGIKCLRYHWYTENNLGLHIKNIQYAYLKVINNSTFRHPDDNFNDMMAWCYTAIALCHDEYKFDCYMADKFNKIVKDRRKEIVINKFRSQDCYGTLTAIERFIKLVQFPTNVNSKDVEVARNTLINQMKMVPILEYYNNELRMKELEGKTIKIA